MNINDTCCGVLIFFVINRQTNSVWRVGGSFVIFVFFFRPRPMSGIASSRCVYL